MLLSVPETPPSVHDRAAVLSYLHGWGSPVKFYEYRTLWEETRNQLQRHVTEAMFYAASLAGGARAGNGLVLAEAAWKRHRRT